MLWIVWKKGRGERARGDICALRGWEGGDGMGGVGAVAVARNYSGRSQSNFKQVFCFVY